MVTSVSRDHQYMLGVRNLPMVEKVLHIGGITSLGPHRFLHHKFSNFFIDGINVEINLDRKMVATVTLDRPTSQLIGRDLWPNGTTFRTSAELCCCVILCTCLNRI